MKNHFFSYFLLILLISGCHSSERPQTPQRAPDSTPTSNTIQQTNSDFYSFMGIDSVARADYVFADSIVDSISIHTITFNALYLTCFKGRIRLKNYEFLRKTNPAEYTAISRIHTAHTLTIDGKELSFNGKGRIGCMNEIPESTMVSVKASVYSFFSGINRLGSFVILDSIEKKYQSTGNNTPLK